MTPEEERAFKQFEDAFNMGSTQPDLATGVLSPQAPATPAMTTQAPITAPLAPREPVDTFTPMFRNSLQDERFQAFSPEEKTEYINMIYDADEQLRDLKPYERETHLRESIDTWNKELKAEAEYGVSGEKKLLDFAGTPMGKFLMPGGERNIQESEFAGDFADALVGIPWVSTIVFEGTGGVARGVQDMIAGVETGAQYFKKELEQGDYDPNQQRFFGDVADWMRQSTDKWPQSTREGVTEDVAGALAGTFGYLAPMVAAAGVTGGGSMGSTSVPMMLAFAGSGRDEVLKEGGVMENPGIVLASAAVQTASERMFGPEAMVGKNLFRKGVQATMNKIAARGAKRLAAGAAGEAVTEGFQNYVEQQVGEWSAGDKGWYDNLEDDDKKAINDGLIFGGIVGSIVSMPQAIGTTTMEARFSKIHNVLQTLEGLTPEERGALGVFNPQALERLSTQPLGEDQAANVRLEEAGKLEFLDPGSAEFKEFVEKGILDESQLTPEQQTEFAATKETITRRVTPTDEAVEPVKAASESHAAAAESIVNKASEYADILEESGETDQAAAVRKGVETFELVEAKDNELAALQGVINSFGINMQFYRSDGDIGIGGVARDSDTILVRWDSTKPQLVAQKSLHEAVHAVAKGDRKAEQALYDMLKESDPDIIKMLEGRVEALYKKRETALSPETRLSETVSMATELAAPNIFRAMRDKAMNQKDWAARPGVLQKMNEKMYTMLAKLSRKSKFVKQLIGERKEAYDPENRREFAKLMNNFIEYLGGKQGAAISLEAEPDVITGDKPIPVPEVIKKREPRIKLGEDAVKDSLKDRATVEEAEPTDKGQKAAPKAEKKDVKGKESPLEKDHGQARLDFSFDQQAKQEIEAGGTSLDQVPDAFKDKKWQPLKGTVNLDVGGGAYDTATNYLKAQKGVTNLVYDPYTRSEKHNQAVSKRIEKEPADTGSAHNVLNVIAEREARIEMMTNISKGVKPGGEIRMAVNENDKSGKGKETKNGWQNNRLAATYLDEVNEVFGNGRVEGNVIIASNGVETDESVVEAHEADPDFSLEIEEITGQDAMRATGTYAPGTKAFSITDSETEIQGQVIIRERYIGTPDQEAYVEWIEVDVDDDGNPLEGDDRFTKLGVRRVMAFREYLETIYPNAVFVGGHRVYGVHAEAERRTGKDPYIRIPIISKLERQKRGLPEIEKVKVTQAYLDDIHGKEEIYPGGEMLDADEVYTESLETLDNAIEERNPQGELLDAGAAYDLLDEHAKTILDPDTGLEDLIRNFGAGDSKVEYSFDWEGDAPDWAALEKEHGVENLAGMHELVEIAEGKGTSYWHLSKEDRSESGLSKESAGTAAAGQERRRIAGGGQKAVHLYTTGTKPEAKVASVSRVLHRVDADLNLLDTRSPEAQELASPDTDEFIKNVIKAGYDGLVDSERGFAQVYRDIKPSEITESRDLQPGESKMKLGSIRVPGGLDGKFTYEELLWLKEQGIDTYQLDEDVHLPLHEKIVRTIQPQGKDTLQTLNNFIFSMLSPNQQLTPNELAYAVVRVRNDEESKAWAARVPWDAPSGESADFESWEKYDKDNKAVNDFLMDEWVKEEGHPKVKGVEQMFWADPVWFRKWYKTYYNRTIAQEFNLQAREKGGMGILGTAEMASIAELNQYYQIDPEWFLMQDTDVDSGGAPSWHTYVERLSTQFSGMQTKVASFAAVWQDPMGAAISAIDRHMGRQFLPQLFPTDRARWKWEAGVIKDWNKSEKGKKGGKVKLERDGQQILNFDELFLRKGGDGFFVTALMDKLGANTAALYTLRGKKPETLRRQIEQRNPKLPDHWKSWLGAFISLPEDRRIQLMSDSYRSALAYNAKEAQKLGLGLFSAQWYLWDRWRRRLEPHEINFPGLYKLPHLSDARITKVRDSHKDAGYLDSTPELLNTEENGSEIHLKPVRSAPPGALTYWSFDEGPTHFPPQSGMRTPLYNLQQAAPGMNLDEQSGPMWSLPEESWMGVIRRKVQDKFFRVRTLQEEITRNFGSIHEDMDVYLHEMLYHGKAAAEIGAFEVKYVKPLMTYLRKNNIDITEFEDYLHARHAGERNKHYRDVWYDRVKERLEKEIVNTKEDIGYAESRGSDTHTLVRRLKRKQEELRFVKKTKMEDIPNAGMTDEAAEAQLEVFRSLDNFKEIQEAEKLFRALMDRKLEILWEGGMITHNQLKAVSTYKYYVPLKGKNYEGDLEDLLDGAGVATGRGFDIRGDELGFAFGFKPGEKHTHPILPQAIVDIEEAIIRSEKNRVGQSMLALIEEFPNSDLYELNKSVKRRVWDKTTGEVKLVEDAFAKNADNVLAVKRDGETYYITFKDARLASAMKNLGSSQMNAAIKILAGVNRFLAKVNTTLNPEFMVANFLRDIQTAGFNLSEEQYKSIRGAALGNVPAAANGIRKAEGFTTEGEADVEADEWVQMYREFVKEGGQIGFFGYNDVVSKANSIRHHMKLNGPGAANTTFRRALQIGSLVERGNTVVENATRLSAYVAARKAGVSKKRAAALARNLTVNFNKKGEAGQIINALWLFSNASIQGTFRMGHAVLRSPNVQKMVGAQIMASYAMAALNRGVAGEDDEDGMNYWEKLQGWQKERNFVVMLPGKGNHIKIPLPYGYNIFHVLGTELEKIVHETSNGRMTPEQAAKSSLNVFNALMGAFNPLGGSSLDTKWTSLRFMVPSAFAPIADTLVNETYYGAPVHPVRSSWDHSPNSERAFKSVNPHVQTLTRYLNKWTGGSEYESGWMDLNPENLEYIVGSYVGAGAKTGQRAVFDAGWVVKALMGKEQDRLAANDIVFLRRIYGEQNDNTVAGVYYENIEDLSQSEKAYNELRGEDRKRWLKKNRWMVPVFKRMSDAQKGIRATKDTDAKNKIRKRFNKYHREAWLSQF